MGSTQEKFRSGISEAQSLSRELKIVGRDLSPTLFDTAIHFTSPFCAQIVAGRFAKLFKRPACVHPQTECGSFSGSPQRRKFFTRFDGAFAFFELLAIKLGVRPVFRANAAHVAGRAWTETIKRTATPVVDVVPASVRGDGVME